ncbi:CAIB/BAIF family enzyme [Xylariomycetidae sp. FL2044]|nr:CAIB/BAIF family enzyme [Xylariomycetidae sp. FL2044]
MSDHQQPTTTTTTPSPSPPQSPSQSSQPYTIQTEAARILHTILLPDPRLQIPASVHSFASSPQRLTFTTRHPSTLAAPFLPAPLKCSESSTALWGLLASFGGAIAAARWSTSTDHAAAEIRDQKVEVDSDAATLFLFSFWVMRVGGRPMSDPEIVRRFGVYDTRRQFTVWRRLVTNVYRTRDASRFFHLHGGLDSSPCLRMLGLPEEEADDDDDNALGGVVGRREDAEMEAIRKLGERVRDFDADWLDIEANEHYRQAGAECLTPEAYAASEHGRAVAGDGLYTIQEFPDPDRLPPVPWPEIRSPTTSSSTSTSTNNNTFRPLEGIRIVDLTRAIAGPTIARLAAAFGATVVRVSNTSLPDLGVVLFESNLGKRDAHLDLKSAGGKAALRDLIAGADVVLDGYRPGALERLGFGHAWVHEVARRRGRGVVYARENCYGWKGPWAHRSGWQQISDAVTGVAWLFGRMWGVDEPVMPFLPNSDFQTGIVGCIGIMNALDQRARKGGNYLVSTSLNQLNSFLISLGLQSPEVQRSLKERWPHMQARYYDDLHRQARVLISTIPDVVPELLDERNFWKMRANLGVPDEEMVFVKPAATYSVTKLGYDSGSCMRGMHEAKWPDE